MDFAKPNAVFAVFPHNVSINPTVLVPDCYINETPGFPGVSFMVETVMRATSLDANG